MNDESLDRDAESILHKHADAHIVLAQEIGALTGTGRVQLDIIEALEHRIVVLESRMENVLARLDGHDLGFATLLQDPEGRGKLAYMLRRQHHGQEREEEGTNVPPQEGTSRS